MFAAGLLANTSSPVSRTLLPGELGGVGTEHAGFRIQSPAKVVTVVSVLSMLWQEYWVCTCLENS